MNLITQLQNNYTAYIKKQFDCPNSLEIAQLSLNTDDQKQQFGDLSSNAALILAKQEKKNPRAVAQEIVDGFSDPMLKKIDIAGPGFLNFYLSDHALDTLAQEIFTQKNAFFKDETLAQKNVNIEFVSANPTGPLHFGHGRGGIIGDVLGNIMKFLGHHVTKEFYINDAGAQIQKLGNSLKVRYEQAAGHERELPEDSYHGEYLAKLARTLYEKHGDAWLKKDSVFFGDIGKKKLLEKIKQTLDTYGIQFDEFFSEKTLHDSDAITTALELIKKAGHTYEKEGATWLQSTSFGDDKDRVLKKQTGEYTYAAPDIAYLQNKVARGHNELIYILGHDHHSYLVRLHSMHQALGLTDKPLHVILYQLVKLKEGGAQVRMSKRAGSIITLDDVIKTVGKDVARFFYLNRKADAQLEFDLDLALSKTEENPVFYIQYAYVRTKSILEKASKEAVLKDITAKDLTNLTPEESLMLKKIASLGELLEAISGNHQTHLLAYYSLELAQLFSRYYNKNRVIDLQNIPQSRARLAIVMIVRDTIGLCLDLLGISKPERM